MTASEQNSSLETSASDALAEVAARTRRRFLRSTAAATGLVLGATAVAKAGSPLAHGGGKAKAAGGGAGSAGIASNGTGGGIEAAAAKPAAGLPNLYANWNAINFSQIRTDETKHVQFLLGALGAMARPVPTFQNLLMPDVFTFARTSFVLENTGVGAYLGAAPIINSKAYLAAAGSILTIEARHSGYLGTLLDQTPDLFQLSFDNPAPLSSLLANAMPFIANLNGGPPLSFSTTPSDANDIAILNVALALEFLEYEFYTMNVPRFFGI